ncbi:MAG: alcohol dehydrogenase [Omnitrophica WOR_2 bacterium GWF2_38_59]|nr:MAG: alcohol dehydrogenase [Omnitrophica WOR_2 bacterium GWF2_38_59]OGX50351.1 MAG: alcohol dehydrogenase [Omnitrophica WOR_2 bacterium RIFOXYA2_FULL_38_17]OGX52208.1 MAG: alcohol dehydrogenase [Omnitrophica WOR_2 bacterium RIFOXYA12_FULL_38_10]OGX59723.1 MAG: alcohol dehydrogenase [Omnitrophica WOR_2 bacterium RIFOXYB2_FULL_38_16]HBG61270.1 alcohol dehydrogenase [Candidatus Omnitrophota bacterium]
MLVAKYYKNDDVRIEEMPRPVIGQGEILVKVIASGICGTDVMEWYRIKKAPRILGHEIAGDIVESKTKKYKVGDRVFVSHHVPCEECKYCLAGNHTACDTLHGGNYDPGGYSEYVRVPAINVEKGVYVLPKNVSYVEGTMIEPLACVVRGHRIIGVRKGQTVLILGSGVSGLMNIQLAKLSGAHVIATDIDEYRLQKAKEFGADQVIHASQKIDRKADKVIICTGAQKAVGQAFECIDKKGTILLFAIPSVNIEIPTVDFWRNELSIVSSYGAAPVDLAESLNVIKNKGIDVNMLITHKLPLKDIQAGFRLVAEAKESLKVVIEP